MFSKILRWVNERWPLSAVIRWSLEEEMPGGTSYAYIFGSCVLIVFLFQVITGVWQLLYFVPTTNQGSNSLNYLRTDIAFGWLIHGLHYWGASAMIILVGISFSALILTEKILLQTSCKRREDNEVRHLYDILAILHHCSTSA